MMLKAMAIRLKRIMITTIEDIHNWMVFPKQRFLIPDLLLSIPYELYATWRRMLPDIVNCYIDHERRWQTKLFKRLRYDGSYLVGTTQQDGCRL